MSFNIKQASKKQSKLKLGLSGASGSGKTWSALLLAEGMGCKNVCVIDTERGSAELYSDRFTFDTIDFEPPYSPQRYIEALTYVQEQNYDCIIIDSISPEWEGVGGCLDIHSKIPGNSYIAWAKVTPLHNKFIESLLSCDKHLIVTTRAKTEYVLEEKNGKQVPRKMGLAPKQREGLEYELTCFLELDKDHNFIASKDRTGLFSAEFPEPFTVDVGKKLLAWLGSGVVRNEKKVEVAVAEPKEIISSPAVQAKPSKPAQKKKETPEDVKEETEALLQAIEVVKTIEEINLCNEVFKRLKPQLPPKVLAHVQEQIDEMNKRYVTEEEIPY